MPVLTKQIKMTSGLLGSMPDFTRAVCYHKQTNNTSTNKGFNIWKINVPGYLFSYSVLASDDGANMDVAYAISWSPTKLQAKDIKSNNNASDSMNYQKCFLLGTTHSDGESGGSTGPQAIVPGSTTYFTLCGGSLSGCHCFAPCACIPRSIADTQFITTSGYTVTENWVTDMKNGWDWYSVITPGETYWQKIFDGNWKANFPSLDLSTLLECRQSSLLSSQENYEVAV